MDGKFQVLSTERKPIPGLYCVGSDTCDIYGGSYPFVLSGVEQLGLAIMTQLFFSMNLSSSTSQR